MKFQLKYEPALILLFVLASVFIFTNLGSVYLWEDEAETALVAKTIWSHGIPKITDGINYFYQEQGRRVGYGDIWAWTPWLQFYIAAISAKLFGTSEWSLRLPFAIAGFLSVVLFFRTSKKLFGHFTALLSTFLLISSVPFLLHVRQCRYYSFVILGTLWAINALLNITENNKKPFSISLFCALLILFHANYITWFGVLFSILVFAFFPTVVHFRKSILITLGSSFALNLPWFLLFKPLHEKTRDFDFGIILESITFYFENLNHYIVPFVFLLLIPIALRLIPKKENESILSSSQKTWIWFFVMLIVFTVFFSLLGPARVFRYLVGIIPILILLVSILIMRLWQKSKLVVCFIVPFYMFTNFFNIFFYQPISNQVPSLSGHLKGRFGSPFISYIQELIHPPQGTIKKISEYLNLHASSKDLVIATYGDLPLMFYTRLRVIGGLSFQALEEAKAADWVIARKVLVSDEDARVMVYLIDNLPWKRYEKIDLGQTDFPWENIPEPSAHQFKSLGFNPDWQIQIYRKLKPEEASRNPDPPKIFYFTPMQKVIFGTHELKKELTYYLLWLRERTGHSETL